MSVLEGKDLKTIFNFHQSQMELITNSIASECQIKGCSNKAVEKFREISEVPNMCEKHFEIFAKELGQIN